MSKQVEVSITCPSCKNKFKTSLFRTLWVENQENRDLVLYDRINLFTCPSCKSSARVKFPFLCTNVKKGFALWYEPYHDPEIDKDIAQYAAHFGTSSFYALAPRIKDWYEFKKKLIEMEEPASRNPPVRPFISPEINADVSGFVRTGRHSSNKLPTENQFYPSWLKHLQSAKKRVFYAMLPFIAVLVFSGGNRGGGLAQEKLGQIALSFLIMTALAFALLTLVHTAASIYKPWSLLSKPFRMYWFFSACWVLTVTLFVMVFDPYNIGGWSEMGTDEYSHMFSIAFVIPIFIGLAFYVYQRYVK
ncbi:MAG: CpXC domain-containing protein [Candidatus Nitrotoga sp.]